MMRRIFQLAIRFFSDKSFARGVTLVELLAVLAIIIIITAIIIPNYRSGGQQLALDRSAYRLAQDIRRIQEMAMSSSEGDCGIGFTGGYGIILRTANDPPSYILFADCNNSEDYDSEPGVEDIMLDQIEFESGTSFDGVQFFDGDWLPAGWPGDLQAHIVFYPPDPTVERNPGGGDDDKSRLILSNNNDQYKCVYANDAGLIYVSNDCGQP